MSTVILILLLGLWVLVLAVCWIIFVRRRNQEQSQAGSLAEFSLKFQKELSEFRSSFQDQILALSRQVGDQYSQNSRFLLDSHKQYADSVDKVQHKLGELQQATKTMMDIGRDIASLQDILKTPKLRGGMGEFFLGQLLAQILPQEYFALQYGFKDGSKVDAVIRLSEGLIPVDAKFPLENFKRYIEEQDETNRVTLKKQFVIDVKKHVDAIATKYILPEEGTFDFALMYIPAENVYYEIIIKSDSQVESLSDYCLRKKVIPVSPNSFYAYLQAIVRGLKGLRIEKSALQVFESLQQLEADFKKVFTDLEKLGGHFANAQSAYERTLKGFDKIQTRLCAIGEQNEGHPIASPEIAGHLEA